MTPFSPISGPLVPRLRPPPRRGSRILLASTRSPARAADSAQLHTDLRPGPGPRLLRLAEARSPLARRLGSSGSWFHTGDGSSRRLDGTAGRAPGLQPTRAPASHVSVASPELSPGLAPLTPISEDPEGATRVRVWWQWGSHRESRKGKLPDRRCCVYLAHLKSSPSIPVRCPFSPGVTADHRECTQLHQERSPRSPTAGFQHRLCLTPEPRRWCPPGSCAAGHLE